MLLVAPLSHVLLPLRDGAIRVDRVTIWLRMCIDMMTFMLKSDFVFTIAPMHEPRVRFPKWLLEHAIEEVFSFESVRVDEFHRALTFLNLHVRVTPESDASLEPMNFGQEFRVLLVDKPRIECLVEVYMVASINNLLELCESIFSGRQDVVVHEDDLLLAVGHSVDVPIGSDCTFLLRNNTPLALVRTSASEESIGDVLRNIRIDGQVRLDVINLLRKFRVDVISSSSTNLQVGIVRSEVIMGEVEYLRPIEDVIVLEWSCPFYPITKAFVICCDLAESQVRIDCGSPLLLRSMAINIKQSYCLHVRLVLLL